jgi:hypothetical protein
MGNAKAEIDVVSRGNQPSAITQLHQPSEDAAASWPAPTIRRQLPVDGPFEMDERQLRGQESDAMAYVLPTAVTKMESMNITVPLTELFGSLKPSTIHVDEVDIGRDQKRHIDGVVCIPGVRPSPDHRSNGGLGIEKRAASL